MDLEAIAAKLRDSRRKRQVPPSGYAVPREKLDRVHSTVAAKWLDSVAKSKMRKMASPTPHRPRSSPPRSIADRGKLLVSLPYFGVSRAEIFESRGVR